MIVDIPTIQRIEIEQYSTLLCIVMDNGIRHSVDIEPMLRSFFLKNQHAMLPMMDFRFKTLIDEYMAQRTVKLDNFLIDNSMMEKD